MAALLLVAIGGAIGASLRHLVGAAALRTLGPSFPWGTMGINVAGSLAMGLLAGALARRSDVSEAMRLFVGVGLLGGFTTFSAFSLDVVVLWERSEAGAAMFYAAGSVVLSILALFAGLWLARTVW